MAKRPISRELAHHPLRLRLSLNRTDGDAVEVWGRDEIDKELITVVHKDTFLWSDLYDELEHHGSINVSIKFEGDA